MVGLDLEVLTRENVTVAVAKAQVEFIRSIGTRLRELREECHFSQTDMAKRLGVTQPRIAQLESGRPGDAPSMEQIAAYAYYCGRTASAFFEKTHAMYDIRERIRVPA
jgi:transcriptional regulator with XRE-family HTH domain